MTSIFRDHAPLYWANGLCVVPIEPGEKRPAKEIRGWQGFCSSLPSAETRERWCGCYPDHGIGLLLNTKIGSAVRIVAVDVDDDSFVAVTRVVLGNCPSGKIGKKGATFFAVAPDEQAVKSTTLKDPAKAGKIDILANGRMTVIPPTTHPETGVPYDWKQPPDKNTKPLPRKFFRGFPNMVAKKRGGTFFEGQKFAQTFGGLIDALPSDADKLKIVSQLETLIRFLSDLKTLVESIPTDHDAGAARTAIDKLTALFAEAKSNPVLSAAIGIRATAPSRRLPTITSQEIERARSEIAAFESLPIDEVRTTLAKMSLRDLQGVANAIGIETTQRIARDNLVLQVATKIINRRGYRSLRDGPN